MNFSNNFIPTFTTHRSKQQLRVADRADRIQRQAGLQTPQLYGDEKGTVVYYTFTRIQGAQDQRLYETPVRWC